MLMLFFWSRIDLCHYFRNIYRYTERDENTRSILLRKRMFSSESNYLDYTPIDSFCRLDRSEFITDLDFMRKIVLRLIWYSRSNSTSTLIAFEIPYTAAVFFFFLKSKFATLADKLIFIVLCNKKKDATETKKKTRSAELSVSVEHDTHSLLIRSRRD